MPNGQEDLIEIISVPEQPQVQQPSEETGLHSVLRNITRTGARFGEAFLGTPGDILQGLSGVGRGLESVLEPGLQALTGLEIPRVPKEEQVGGFPVVTPEELTPTTEGVRKGTTALVKPGLLEPQTPAEERLDEFTQDLTSILHPLLGPVGKARALKGLATAGLGNLAKWGAKEIGIGVPGQEGVKLGTMLLTSIAGGLPNLNDRARDLYKRADDLMPRGLKVSAKPLQNAISKLDKQLGKGIGIAEAPSKEFISKRLGELEGAIDPTTNTIPVEDSVQFIKDINDFFKQSSVPQNAKSSMGELISSLKDTFKQVSKKHPEFVNALTEGSEILRTINTSSRANDFIQGLLGGIRGLGLPLTYIFGGKGLAGITATQASKFASNFIDRIARSPAIQKAYAQTVASALKENSATTTRSLKKLNKLLEKELPEFTGEPESEEEMVELIS